MYVFSKCQKSNTFRLQSSSIPRSIEENPETGSTGLSCPDVNLFRTDTYRKKKKKREILIFPAQIAMKKARSLFVPLNSVACRAAPRHSRHCESKEATPTDVRLLERCSRRTSGPLQPILSCAIRDSQEGSYREILENKCENNYDSFSLSHSISV